MTTRRRHPPLLAGLAAAGLLALSATPAPSATDDAIPQRLAQGRTSECPPKNPPPKQLNTINDVFTALCACWRPPPDAQARAGMEVTVRFSFTRSGDILGEPRFTFVTANVSTEVRAVYKRAVAETLSRCAPLPFTDALGNALAGRPFAIRFIDDRGVKKVELHGK